MRLLARSLVLLLMSAPLAAQTWRSDASLPPAVVGFGSAIVLSGGDLFVGRTGAIPGFPLNPSRTGAIHIFRPAGGTWNEAAQLSPADLQLGDGFGSALAVDGPVMAVGAPSQGSGAVYLFEQRGGSWAPAGKLIREGAGTDGFGEALSLKGGLLVVSAPGRDSARGEVYAYRRAASGAWDAGVRIGAGTVTGGRFGAALALDGDRVLVGAPGPGMIGGPFSAGARPQPGAAILFRAAGGQWTEEKRLSPGADSTVAFGTAVLLSGGEAFVGAPRSGRATGAVYQFRQADGWSAAEKIGPSTPQPGTGFGMTMGRAGSTLLVGAQIASQGAGAVFVMERGPAGWTEKQKLSGRSSSAEVMFGAAIAATADLAVIGGPMADFFEGIGYVFGRDPASGEWRERGTVVDKPAALAAITGGEKKCADGKIGDFPCDRVDLLSFLPTESLGASRGIMLNDIWGWTDPETNREYALVGRMDGTAFVDITDPSRPTFLGSLPLHEGANPNLWRDIKTYRHYAFIVSDGAGPHGVQIFDLTRLRNVTNAPATFTEDAHYDRIASAHNIAIDTTTGFAYTIGNSAGGETCGGALHMIDIRDPLHPVFAGCFADKSTGNQKTGYTHDNQCVVYQGPDSRYTGKEVCFNASETAVGIADVTDKANPKPIAVAAYPNTSYAHQGWLSEDQRYFFLNDEGDEIAGSVPKTRTLVWDVSDLEEPVLVKEFLGATSATDHNMYVRGKYLFQSNYVAGLRVIDISDPVNPKEVGYFDSVPWGENSPGFAGTWSNYPYFKSGTIVFTSMKEGLFVVRHTPAQPLVP
jgi:choice-of-anchor B domain-containing protein